MSSFRKSKVFIRIQFNSGSLKEQVILLQEVLGGGYDASLPLCISIYIKLVKINQIERCDPMMPTYICMP
jgi:hypothetical protein